MEQGQRTVDRESGQHSVGYDLSAIRRLLTDAFMAQDLWRFCQDRPAFRPALTDFGYNASLGEMIDILIEHCRTRLLFADLLSAIQESNPKQYERYHDQVYAPSGDVPATQVVKSPPFYHNLPHPDYGRFVGREEELARVHRILRPYPHSQYPIVVIDGIGGIGKSALALEAAHRFRHSPSNRNRNFGCRVGVAAPFSPRSGSTETLSGDEAIGQEMSP